MSRKFKIIKNYYEEDVQLYDKGTIEIKPGITCLVGCNGAGKTTLLHQIANTLEDENIPFFEYNNLEELKLGSMKQKLFVQGDPSYLATSIMSSEGENIILNLGILASKIGRFANLHKDDKEIWILLDAVDSGLSIDSIVSLKLDLLNTILEYNQDKDVYIVVSGNNFEIAKDAMCFNVITGKYVQIKTYETFRKIILKSAERKAERYGK